MRFIFINRFYWPDEPATAQLLTDLAEQLVAFGHDVTVITSRPAGNSVGAVATRRGVSIRRVRVLGSGSSHSVGRLIAFATFQLRALAELASTARRGDKVVVLTDPPLIGIGAWMVARTKHAQVFHWVHDVYPEIAVTVTRRRWLRGFQPARNLAWRRSDACVAVTSEFIPTLQRAGLSSSQIKISANWAPAGLTRASRDAVEKLRQEWKLSGKFVALYSGNLGRVHELEPLLEVAEHLRSHPQLAIVVVGAGAQRDRLVAEADRRGLNNLQFHRAQPRTRLAETLAVGDVHFVTLRPGCESAVFPSKLYGIAAAGRPALVIAPLTSELARIVDAHGFGHAFEANDSKCIADHLLALSRSPAEHARLSDAALKFARENSGVERAACDWLTLAEALHVT